MSDFSINTFSRITIEMQKTCATSCEEEIKPAFFFSVIKCTRQHVLVSDAYSTLHLKQKCNSIVNLSTKCIVCIRRWLNQQLTEAQLGKLPVVSASSRFNTFNRPNTSGMAYSCLTSTSRPGEATTPLSSNSSMGANSGSTAFKNQFPMSSPYLSSTGTPITGIPFIQGKPQPSGFQSGLGVFNTAPALAGSQRSTHVPVTKIAVQAAQKVQYRPQGMTATSAIAGSYTAAQMPMDETSLLNTWEDPSSWGTKHNILPRPQLSFADRSASILGSNNPELDYPDEIEWSYFSTLLQGKSQVLWQITANLVLSKGPRLPTPSRNPEANMAAEVCHMLYDLCTILSEFQDARV